MTVDLEKKGLKTPVTLTRGALVYAVLALVLSTFTVSIAGVLYTNHTQRQSDHRWCALFRDLDRPVDPNIKDPAQRARTQQTVGRIHKLRVDYGCVDE